VLDHARATVKRKVKTARRQALDSFERSWVIATSQAAVMFTAIAEAPWPGQVAMKIGVTDGTVLLASACLGCNQGHWRYIEFRAFGSVVFQRSCV